jgi:hypothetical protein
LETHLLKTRRYLQTRMFIKSCNKPIFLHLYGFKCLVHVFVIIIILKGLNLMILITFTYERKKIKSKQYKHFKRRTLKFDSLKCNSTQRVCIWTHNFQILHWLNHLLVSTFHKCHGKFKLRVSKPFSRGHGSISIL